MSIRRTISTLALALAALALNVQLASARPAREFVGSFGQFEEPAGIAVDLETGDVYVTEPRTETVEIFGAAGGAPAGGVPTQITGLHMQNAVDGVAVDNSCYEHEPRLVSLACEEYDPSYGDVYVADNHRADPSEPKGVSLFKLNGGKYEQVGEIEAGPAGRSPILSEGVTVDPRGDVYMTGFPVVTAIFEQKALGGGLVEIPQHDHAFERLSNVAVDRLGDVYASEDIEAAPGTTGVIKSSVDAAGEVLSEEVFAAPLPTMTTPRPLAVDRATDNVYVGDGDAIAEYDSADELLLEFGSREPAGGSLSGARAVNGIAVNSVTGQVYVVNASGGDVDVFGAVLAAPVIPEAQPPASDPQRTSVLLAGTADPEGGGGSYYYQYVPAGEYEPGAADPYTAGVRTATGTLPAGHGDESIERVVLAGLKPGTTYHYRLVVSNATGTSYGPDQSFMTAPATPPTAATGVAVEVGATSATLTGMVGPRGLPTSYAFEVGTDTGYGGAKLFGNAGEGSGEEQVSVTLRFLIPDTTYHYRLLASSFDGTTYGLDASFTTPAVPSPVTQPAGTPLLASPSVVFPSIAGAITGPAGGSSKPRKALTGAQKLAAALRACHRQRPARRRAGCEARVRKAHPHTKTNDPKKR
jgi:DNA-binding beta-propeller fold protein YncE